MELIDLITNDESDQMLPFGIEDLITVLSPKEYKVLFDHFAHDGDYRSLAENMGLSKSAVARLAQSAIKHPKTWVEQLKRGPKAKAIAHQVSMPLSVPWMQRGSWRPDRLFGSELLPNWFEGTEVDVVPFFTCSHDPREGTYNVPRG